MKLRPKSLNWPAKEHDIRLLFKAEVARFEAGDKTGSEGFRRPTLHPARKRAIELKTRRRKLAKLALIRKEEWLDKELIEGLIKTLSRGSQKSASLASATHCRDYQIRFSGSLLKFLEEAKRKGYSAKFVTIISHQWRLKPSELTPKRLKRIAKAFRQRFRRKCAQEVKGHLVAVLDGSYDEFYGVFQIHFHGIATGEMIDFIKTKVRSARAFKATPEVLFPIKCQALKNPPRQCGYLWKWCWDVRRENGLQGEDRRVYKSKKMPEPFSTHYLSVLAALSHSDVMFMINITVENGCLKDNIR